MTHKPCLRACETCGIRGGPPGSSEAILREGLLTAVAQGKPFYCHAGMPYDAPSGSYIPDLDKLGTYTPCASAEALRSNLPRARRLLRKETARREATGIAPTLTEHLRRIGEGEASPSRSLQASVVSHVCEGMLTTTLRSSHSRREGRDAVITALRTVADTHTGLVYEELDQGERDAISRALMKGFLSWSIAVLGASRSSRGVAP